MDVLCYISPISQIQNEKKSSIYVVETDCKVCWSRINEIKNCMSLHILESKYIGLTVSLYIVPGEHTSK